MPPLPAGSNDLTAEIIASAIEVHRILGPGLLERIYEEALALEMSTRSLPFKRQALVPVQYKGSLLEMNYRIDLIVRDEVVVELKAVQALLPVHTAQLLTYLKLKELRLGLLINFNVDLLRHGIKRVVR